MSANIRFLLHIYTLNIVLKLVKLHAVESLSKPFHFYLTALSREQMTNINRLIQQPVMMQMSGWQRHGYIESVTFMTKVNNHFQYRIKVSSFLFFLNIKVNSRIFKNISVLELIKFVLHEEKHARFNIQFAQQYAKQPYIIQYKESNLNLLNRLLIQYHIFYYFQHDNTQHTMVFIDDIMKFPPHRGHRVGHRKQHADLRGNITYSYGQTFSLKLHMARRVMKESGHQLITNVIHHASMLPQKDFFYCNHYIMQPAMFLNKKNNKKVLIAGHQYAVVKNDANSLIAVDKRAQVSVTFLWDSRQAAIWVPIVQSQAGQYSKQQWLPQLGETVVVFFINGDPMQPIIIGSSIDKKQRIDNKNHIATKNILNNQHMNRQHALIFDDMQHCLKVLSSGKLYYFAKHHRMHYVQKQYCIELEQGDYELDVCKGDISIEANQGFEFTVGGSTFTFDPSGDCHFTAKKIIIQNEPKSRLKPAARVSDEHICPRETHNIPHEGGVIASGSQRVFIDGMYAARLGDCAPCRILVNKIAQGAPNILFEQQPAAKAGDGMQHGGHITTGSSSVWIGAKNCLMHDEDIHPHRKNYIKIKWQN
jgi:uncharacterized protein involved in type VI secretion and phage assembly/uncharacterized Zn-binding protein involved in type VI secretion